MDSFKVLLERAGLNLSDGEIHRLQPYYALYVEALSCLYEAELQHEEIAGSFNPIVEEENS